MTRVRQPRVRVRFNHRREIEEYDWGNGVALRVRAEEGYWVDLVRPVITFRDHQNVIVEFEKAVNVEGGPIKKLPSVLFGIHDSAYHS